MACADYGGKRYLNLNGISWTLDGDIGRAVSVRPLAQKMMHMMKMQNVNNLDHVWQKHTMDDGTVIRLESFFGSDRAYVYCVPALLYIPKKEERWIRRFVPAICIKLPEDVSYYEAWVDPEYYGDIVVCGSPTWQGIFGIVNNTDYPREKSTSTFPLTTKGGVDIFPCEYWGKRGNSWSISVEGTGSLTYEEIGDNDTVESFCKQDSHYVITFKNLIGINDFTYTDESWEIWQDGHMIEYWGTEDCPPFVNKVVFSYQAHQVRPDWEAFKYIEPDCPVDSFLGKWFFMYQTNEWVVDSPEETHCQNEETNNYTGFNSGNCGALSAQVSKIVGYTTYIPNKLYAVLSGGKPILIDSGDDINDYFTVTDSHILSADGVIVYMYAYTKSKYNDSTWDYDTIYTRYGYFYGDENTHFQSEKFYPAGIVDGDGAVAPFHKYIGLEYGFGQCAGFMVEERVEE